MRNEMPEKFAQRADADGGLAGPAAWHGLMAALLAVGLFREANIGNPSRASEGRASAP